MRNRPIIPVVALLVAFSAVAEEAETDTAANDEPEVAAAPAESSPQQGDGIESPRTMSGMSVLGNEEAPKSLVIVPWKASELGDDLGLSDTLDDRAKPVDKDVFERELAFYAIRSGD